MMNSYDAIVLGLGGMGSATAYHLARRGQRVLGLDVFERGHTRGSSHGRSRIIREAYYAAPEYVPLVQRSYALWRELEAELGTSLLMITGGLLIEPPGGPMVTGAVRSAGLHNLDYEELTADEIRSRFPGLKPTDDLIGVFEPNAGVLAPEACVAAHLDLAASHGADLRHSEPARRWVSGTQGVVVETDNGAYSADQLVVTAGPWASELLPELGLPLSVERIVNVHFEPSQPERFVPDRCPIHIWEVPEGHFYGLPSLPGQGMKIGRHDAIESCTPQTVRREVAPAEIAMLRQMLDR